VVFHCRLDAAVYVEYAVRDVQAMWECYRKLPQRYEAFGLEATPAHKIYSKASLGKLI
jgi:hypothetical protein